MTHPTGIANRLETWLTPGIPDVLICDHESRFHLVELKFCVSDKVDIRPHQVSFLSKHKKANVWLLVKKVTELGSKGELYLYRGDSVVDVAYSGLQTPPYFKISLDEQKDGMVDVLHTIGKR